MAQAQISTYLSVSTKERLERFVRAKGLSRAHVIEQALLHHMRALEEFPAEAVIPPRFVLTPTSADLVRDMIERSPPPSDALRKLFEDRDRSDR